MNGSCHTYEWVMSHMNGSCHTYEWVMSHMNGSCHIWKGHVTHMAHVRMIYITHMNESFHTYEWVMSRMWMGHVTHMNESCHTWMSHVTHTNQSCHTLVLLIIEPCFFLAFILCPFLCCLLCMCARVSFLVLMIDFLRYCHSFRWLQSNIIISCVFYYIRVRMCPFERWFIRFLAIIIM